MKYLVVLSAAMLLASCSHPRGTRKGEGIVSYFVAARNRTEVYEQFERLGYDPSSDVFKGLIREDSPTSLVFDLMGGKGEIANAKLVCRLRFTFAPSGRLEKVSRDPLGNPEVEATSLPYTNSTTRSKVCP